MYIIYIYTLYTSEYTDSVDVFLISPHGQNTGDVPWAKPWAKPWSKHSKEKTSYGHLSHVENPT